MIRQLGFGMVVWAGICWGQDHSTVPVYNVTVIERSLQAVNYQYRAGPTEIDFKGTVLLPKGKGHAMVESHRGRTEIDAKVQNLTSPQKFGREYLTYVLWAISPEGAAHNICEIVPNGSDDAHVHVTTELQAFGLLITAEPYAAVRQPSDVVVLQNEVRPETIGKIEPIVARAELLPRGHYVLDKQASAAANPEGGPKVSMGEYEQLSDIYQAESALNAALLAHADTLAAETYDKARRLLEEAKQARMNRAGTSSVVQSAREAAQTAEDAKVIAEKRGQEAKIARAQSDSLIAQQEKAQAQAQTQQARLEAEQARAQIDSERAAREQAEARASAPQALPPPQEPAPARARVVMTQKDDSGTAQKVEYRRRVMAQVQKVAAVRDTPRGLVVTIPDGEFVETALRPAAGEQLERVAQALAGTNLSITVEGNTDTADTENFSARRAASVREALLSGGAPANSVIARGLGNSRLTESNASESGRMANRRVEVIISGNAMGDAALWDQAYRVK
jgi:flagellar motor protein MotB